MLLLFSGESAGILTEVGRHFWLLQTWEPNPVDDPNGRPLRTGMLARRLTQRGDRVTWFASHFDHIRKQWRGAEPRAVECGDGLTIHLVPALGYARNVSAARLRDHAHVARSWRDLVHDLPPPDAIVASYPTIELSREAVAYGLQRQVPVVVDIRDQYPDVFWMQSPGWMRPLIWLLCGRMRGQASEVFSGAAAITANGPEALAWALLYGRRTRTERDLDLPMSYDPPLITPEDRASAEAYWNHQRLGRPLVAFAGTIGHMFDFEPVFRAARAHPDVTFAIAGDGMEFESLRAEAAKLPNMRTPGRVDSARVKVLLEQSTLGLAPYRDLDNFELGVTNKPVEYLANGLPVLTSLRRGPIHDLLHATGAGATYLNAHRDSLAQLLGEWKSRPLEPARMAAARAFHDHFHPDLVYGRWLELLDELAPLAHDDQRTTDHRP